MDCSAGRMSRLLPPVKPRFPLDTTIEHQLCQLFSSIALRIVSGKSSPEPFSETATAVLRDPVLFLQPPNGGSLLQAVARDN